MSEAEQIDSETAHDASGDAMADEPVKRDLMLSLGLLGVVGFTFLLTSLVTHL